MSQLFRALKKAPKSTTANSQSVPDDTIEEELEVSKPNEKLSPKNVQIPALPDLVHNKHLDAKSERETNENTQIDSSVEDLAQFCTEIDEFLQRAQNILDNAYTKDEQRILQRRLKNSVNELLGIQNQIKTVMDNLKSIKLQIAAVRDNIDDHKSKFSDLKVEERRTRFLLAQESNKREKNARNQEKSVRRDFESKIPKYFITPAINGSSRANTNNTTLTNYFTIPNNIDTETNINTVRNSQNNASNRLSRPTSRPLSSTVKRVKALRAKKDAPLPPTPKDDSPGVTIFLQPISDYEKTENGNGTSSHHSTPNTSIVNFSWFNNNPPDQTHSDTGTNSAVSASNSLFVFNSNGRIDDLD